jgi:hypothetical protein
MLHSAEDQGGYPLLDYPTPNSHRSASIRSVKRKSVPTYDPRTGEVLEQRSHSRSDRMSVGDGRTAEDQFYQERYRQSAQIIEPINQSRFSLDSDFSGQTHSTGSSHRRHASSNARRDSVSSHNGFSSSGEAMSQEGEWMANLATKRRPYIRSSSQKKPSRRVRMGEMQGLPEEQVDEEERSPKHHSLPAQHRPQSQELARTAIRQSWQGRGKEIYASV